jgi:GrpB-like predicted nucleotidyltransferase (UPF0157 family)
VLKERFGQRNQRWSCRLELRVQPASVWLLALGKRHMHILPYFSMPAEFRVYDPKFQEVAALICKAINALSPEFRMEHVGSTSVPGCGGKGVIDLMLLYPDGLLARARSVLDDLGFQKQTGRDPFPETRPMRVGSIKHDEHLFRIHVHVISLVADEYHELIFFREALRASPELRRRYQECKQAILARGIVDSFDYCEAKGAFIAAALKERQSAVLTQASREYFTPS